VISSISGSCLTTRNAEEAAAGVLASHVAGSRCCELPLRVRRVRTAPTWRRGRLPVCSSFGVRSPTTRSGVSRGFRLAASLRWRIFSMDCRSQTATNARQFWGQCALIRFTPRPIRLQHRKTKRTATCWRGVALRVVVKFVWNRPVARRCNRQARSASLRGGIRPWPGRPGLAHVRGFVCRLDGLLRGQSQPAGISSPPAMARPG
jgi:hypothetical protein